MDPGLIKPAIEAIESGDGASALDLLKQLIASAAGCDPHSGPESATLAEDPDGDADEDGSEDGADGAAPPKRGKLTAQQLRICREMEASPADFLAIQRAFNTPMRPHDGDQRVVPGAFGGGNSGGRTIKGF